MKQTKKTPKGRKIEKDKKNKFREDKKKVNEVIKRRVEGCCKGRQKMNRRKSRR